MEGCDDGGMVVAGVVDAVAGEEVQDDVALHGVELGARAEPVFGLHLEQIEKTDPLRVDVIDISLNRGCRGDGGDGGSQVNAPVLSYVSNDVIADGDPGARRSMVSWLAYINLRTSTRLRYLELYEIRRQTITILYLF